MFVINLDREVYTAVLRGFVFVVALIVISSICNGYALSVLWGWFLVPVFHLPQLSIPTAIGIALVIGYLTKQETHDSRDDKRSFGEVISRATVMSILKPRIALLFGWVVHLFM
ncbi:MAG TPA: hypothetical protein VNF51_00560 [Candidatus Paceibacterota bacterium]|nr:hypothetical protein [Candidatus Paceibacterota bacterium]